MYQLSTAEVENIFSKLPLTVPAIVINIDRRCLKLLDHKNNLFLLQSQTLKPRKLL